MADGGDDARSVCRIQLGFARGGLCQTVNRVAVEAVADAPHGSHQARMTQRIADAHSRQSVTLAERAGNYYVVKFAQERYGNFLRECRVRLVNQQHFAAVARVRRQIPQHIQWERHAGRAFGSPRQWGRQGADHPHPPKNRASSAQKRLLRRTNSHKPDKTSTSPPEWRRFCPRKTPQTQTPALRRSRCRRTPSPPEPPRRH